MGNKIEVEIYINQLITFFEKNPNDLIELIGETDKSFFYEKIKSQSYLNLENGDDVTLTHQQLINIVVELKKDKNPEEISKYPFFKTKYGY